jgi:hypothetical protein
MIKVSARKIAEREMRDVNVPNVPGSRCGLAAYRLPEKSKLEAEAVAIRGGEIAGVIPPLGLEGGMGEVVAGEGVMITGKRDAVGLRSGWRSNEQPETTESTQEEEPEAGLSLRSTPRE